jgi:cytochrome c oxidase assembly protein subunit 15
VLVSLIALYLAIRLYEGSEVRAATTNLIYGAVAILIIQGAVGYRQFALGLPELLVGIHLFGATLTWIFTWNIHLRMRNR